MLDRQVFVRIPSRPFLVLTATVVVLGALTGLHAARARASASPPDVPAWWNEASSYIATLPPDEVWPSNQCTLEYGEEEENPEFTAWSYVAGCGGYFPTQSGAFQTFMCTAYYGETFAVGLQWSYSCALETLHGYSCQRYVTDRHGDTGWPEGSECDRLVAAMRGEGGGGGGEEEEGGGGGGEEEGGEEEPTPEECEAAGFGPNCEYVEEEDPEEKEEEKTCDQSHHGFVHHKWSARAVLAGLPDPHLFDFNVSVPYCYNGKAARVNGPSVVGTVNYGFATGVLEVLGFETIYDPSKEAVYASDSGAAEMTGEFGMTFAWATLVDKVGIRRFLKDKAEAYLARSIERLIPKYGYGSRLRRQLALEMSKLEREIMDTLEEKLDRIKPGFLRRWLEPKVLSKMEDFLDRWRHAGTALFSSHNLKSSAASKLAAKVVGTLFKILDPRSTFPMWRPLVTASVTGPGAVSVSEADDYKNPWLVVSQIE